MAPPLLPASFSAKRQPSERKKVSASLPRRIAPPLPEERLERKLLSAAVKEQADRPAYKAMAPPEAEA